MPSVSSGVWPLGTRRRSETTAWAARDRMPRAEPRSGGPQAEHGEDPPVDVIRRRVQAAAIREDVTARPVTFPNSFLILIPQCFVPIFQSHRAPGWRSAQRFPRSARVGAVHAKGPTPARVRPLCALVWQLVVGDIVRPRRPHPDDFGFITIPPRAPSRTRTVRHSQARGDHSQHNPDPFANRDADCQWKMAQGSKPLRRSSTSREGEPRPAPPSPSFVMAPGRRPSRRQRTGGRRWRPAPWVPRRASRSRR